MSDQLLSEGTPESVKPRRDEFLGEPEPDGDAPVDIWAFARGVTPITRKRPLYMDLGLLAERDEVGIALEDARALGDNDLVVACRERISELTEQIMNTRLIVTLQGMSRSRKREMVDELMKMKIHDKVDQAFHILAEMIVEPEGIDVEWLKEVSEVQDTQIADLITASEQMNAVTPSIRASAPF